MAEEIFQYTAKDRARFLGVVQSRGNPYQDMTDEEFRTATGRMEKVWLRPGSQSSTSEPVGDRPSSDSGPTWNPSASPSVVSMFPSTASASDEVGSPPQGGGSSTVTLDSGLEWVRAKAAHPIVDYILDCFKADAAQKKLRERHDLQQIMALCLGESRKATEAAIAKFEQVKVTAPNLHAPNYPLEQHRYMTERYLPAREEALLRRVQELVIKEAMVQQQIRLRREHSKAGQYQLWTVVMTHTYITLVAAIGGIFYFFRNRRDKQTQKRIIGIEQAVKKTELLDDVSKTVNTLQSTVEQQKTELQALSQSIVALRQDISQERERLAKERDGWLKEKEQLELQLEQQKSKRFTVRLGALNFSL